MENISLSDRIKLYEDHSAVYLMPNLPIILRLDGSNWSNGFTKGLSRPFDDRLSILMINLTKFMVEKTGALVGYTGSDEITLVLKDHTYYNGKLQKIVSETAAWCSIRCATLIPQYLPEKIGYETIFDCRAFNIPSLTEAVNALMDREFSVTRNSISMAAETVYSHNALLGKTSSEKQEMLFQKGINWNDYPAHFKRGVYVKRSKKLIKFTTDEINKLPLKHAARTNPDLTIERSVIEALDLPPINTLENRYEILL